MVVDIVGISLPIVTLIVSALLTIPIFKIVRKTNHKTALTLCWFIAVFLNCRSIRSQPSINLLQHNQPDTSKLKPKR